jgi:hypothetical protein
MERKGTTASINKKGKAITLFSKKDSFPIKITLVDKDDTVTETCSWSDFVTKAYP